MTDEEFEAFVRVDGERLRRVLVARYGVDIGCDAAAGALGWAWEHWDRVRVMANPAGYVYRVGQTHARRAFEHAQPVMLPVEAAGAASDGGTLDARAVGDDLAGALRSLPERQRLTVVMVHVYGWTPIEVARITGTPAVTVRSHLRRGLRRLRVLLTEGVE